MNQTIVSGFKLLSNELKLNCDQLQQIRLHCFITANYIKPKLHNSNITEEMKSIDKIQNCLHCTRPTNHSTQKKILPQPNTIMDSYILMV